MAVRLAPWSAVLQTHPRVLPSRGAQLQRRHLQRPLPRRPRLVPRASMERTQLAAGRAMVRKPIASVLRLDTKCSIWLVLVHAKS